MNETNIETDFFLMYWKYFHFPLKFIMKMIVLDYVRVLLLITISFVFIFLLQGNMLNTSLKESQRTSIQHAILEYQNSVEINDSKKKEVNL